MTVFLIIASLACLVTAWLMFLPLNDQSSVAKRDKQKTAFFLFLLMIVFPLLFYLFVSR